MDNDRGVVWVGTHKEIIQYTVDGKESYRYQLKRDNEADGKQKKGAGRSKNSSQAVATMTRMMNAIVRTAKIPFIFPLIPLMARSG